MSRHEELGDPAGVSLRTYAAIRAALAEGFTLDEALRVEAISRAAWDLASVAWGERLARELRAAEAGELAMSFQAALREAEEAHARPIRPADRDPRAFVDLIHAVKKSRAPEALLAKWGMRRPDIRRLERAWAERAAIDPATREALAAAEVAPRRPPTPNAAPRPALRRLPPVTSSARSLDVAPEPPLQAAAASPRPIASPVLAPDVTAPTAAPLIDDSTNVLPPRVAPHDTTMAAVDGAMHASEDGFRAALTAVAIPELSLEAYAMFQVELRMKGGLDASMAHRYGVASVAVQRALELRYRDVFAAHPDMAERFASKLRELMATFGSSS